MGYMKKEIRNLVEDMEATFVLPRDWKDYLYEVEKNHNIIVKTKDSFYCTNCQQTFSCNAKVKNLHKCPCCKKKLEVRTNKLKHLEYKDNIMMLDNCNGRLIVRLFEMRSTYKADRQEFEHSTVEYARKIVDDEYRELRNERISPGVTSFCVNHCRANNGKWRLYDGYWYGSLNYGYLYKNNLEKVLKGTNLEKSRLWDAIRDPYTKGYNIKDLLYQAKSPLFETLVELKLYNLAESADDFRNRGSFNKIFGISKDYYEFMKKHNITYDELRVLREYQVKDIKKIRFLTKYSGSLERIKKYMSLDKFIEYFKSNKLEDSRLYLDYLEFAKQLGIDLKNKKYLFPKNLKQMHDEYEKQIEILEQEKLTKSISTRAEVLKKNIFKNNGFIIFPAESVQAMIEESTQQHNCVRTYADKYANGECDIYFMRKANKPTESLVTVEVVENKVVQKRIKHNEKTTEKQDKFLKTWERKVLNRVAT